MNKSRIPSAASFFWPILKLKISYDSWKGASKYYLIYSLNSLVEEGFSNKIFFHWLHLYFLNRNYPYFHVGNATKIKAGSFTFSTGNYFYVFSIFFPWYIMTSCPENEKLKSCHLKKLLFCLILSVWFNRGICQRIQLYVISTQTIDYIW